MYIPMVEIPGCRPGFRNDNCRTGNLLASGGEYEPEPRETVTIHLSSLPTYEAVAEFYSYIAYPDPVEATQRKKYSIALSRWAVGERARIEQRWRESEQTIRPIIFSQPEKLFLDTYRRGSQKLWQRAHCAFVMLLPHLVDELLEGLPPTVSNVALKAGAKLGYSEASQKTFEWDIWRPVKPVAHAAAAIMLTFGVLSDPEQGWDEAHLLCYQQPFLSTLFYEDVFRNIVLMLTGLLHVQVPSCDRFKIRYSDTIRFIVD